MEGDNKLAVKFGQATIFQSTPSAWRETCKGYKGIVTDVLFQSTPSAWRETQIVVALVQAIPHFNPLPPHGGRRNDEPKDDSKVIISIHSLRMEGDLYERMLCGFANISIHSLRMEGDHTNHIYHMITYIISIHSLRMEGDGGSSQTIPFVLISIHSLRMEGDPSPSSSRLFSYLISIHSLRMEGDILI